MARKEDKLRPYRVDYFDISEMKDNDLALVKSVVVRAVTATEAVYHDTVAQQGRIIIRAYRFYKNLGPRKKDVYKPVEDLFTANKAIKIMDAVEAYRAKLAAPVAAPVPPPPSPTPAEHVTRMSDSSLYDEVCVNCGATDTSGKLNQPCPNPQKSAAVAAVARTAAEIGADPQVLAAHTIDVIQNLSGPLSPATVAAVEDLKGFIAHDEHEQLVDKVVVNSTDAVGKHFPQPNNTFDTMEAAYGVNPVVHPDEAATSGYSVAKEIGSIAARAGLKPPRVPHWDGCACEVCETPSISGTDITPLVTVTGIWERVAPILGFGAVLVFVIYAVLKILHHH